MSPINVFVLGLDEANLAELRAAPGHEHYRFHALLTISELQEGDIPIVELLDKARQQLKSFDGDIDAIVGFWDFPVSSMVPILCAEFDLPGAPLRPIVTCEHKYWSRLEQRKVIDELPGFALVDLDRASGPPESLRYPMWLKPIKGFSSELAFRVDDDDQFAGAVDAIRQGIGRIGEPFQYVLDQLDLPDEIARIGPRCCLAEEALVGDQVATEGFVYHGEIEVYGVLDSINYPESSTFLRHQYPSQLPAEVSDRLKDLSRRVIRQIGLDNSTFSIEFFYDRKTGAINVLEINPRHSQSHAPLFDLVDGVPNHHVMLSIALDRDPRFRPGRGPYRIAAKYYHRRFSDGIVHRIPSAEEIKSIQRDIPGVLVHPVPRAGQRLSELVAQDSYSFELTNIMVGADSVDELESKYERVTTALRYEIEDVTEQH